jgi:nucleotide-binding universal stress UspA family protein
MDGDDVVVCGVADAETAETVIAAARRLATAYDTHLTIVHAFDEPVAETNETMDAVRAATADDTDVEIRLVEGPPAEQLLQIAAAEHATWIVVGSHGRRRLGATFGGVSRRLAQTANCPIVVVGDDLPTGRTQGGTAPSVVCGVDGSTHALAAAGLAGELADRLRIRAVVVHAPRTLRSLAGHLGRETTPSLSVQPDAAAAATREIVAAAVEAAADPAAETVVEPGPPDRVLADVAARENAQLLVIAGRGAGAVRTTLLGSVAVSLAAASPVPLVIVPEPAEAAVSRRTAARSA